MDINTLLAFLPQPYFGITTAVISLAAVVTAAFPPPVKPETAIGRAYRALDVLALNVFHGKTAAKAVAEGSVVPVVPAVAAPAVVVPVAAPKA